MPDSSDEWVLLVYKLPSQPTRLRLQIWRRLQRMGAIYLLNAAWLLPARPELVENMHYIAGTIEEMGGSCRLFTASSLLPGAPQQIAEEFRALADSRFEEIRTRLERIHGALGAKADPAALERAEEELKRERIAAMRARRLAYFGSAREAEVDAQLEELRRALDDLYRSVK